jgi:rubrerythrin
MSDALTQFATTVDAAIRRNLFSQTMSKAFAFAAYAEAEDSGEGEFFARTLHHVADTRLRRMVERHRDDERRHAHILRERREALGLPELPVPAHLMLVERLSDAAGGVLDKPLATADELADAFALLYVIEERALDEFARSSKALAEAGDEESAALFLTIRKDEERHLRYCNAVGSRYAADFPARVDRMRAIELKAYGAASRDWTWHQIESGYLKLPFFLDLLARSMLTLTGWLKLPAPAPEVSDVVPSGQLAAA